MKVLCMLYVRSMTKTVWQEKGTKEDHFRDTVCQRNQNWGEIQKWQVLKDKVKGGCLKEDTGLHIYAGARSDGALVHHATNRDVTCTAWHGGEVESMDVVIRSVT